MDDFSWRAFEPIHGMPAARSEFEPELVVAVSPSTLSGQAVDLQRRVRRALFPLSMDQVFIAREAME